MGHQAMAARAALHHWEEPCISGTRGSGTVFFSGCTLRCCFCQNHTISRGNLGTELTPDLLAQIFLNLQNQGAHNINLVTATHFLPSVIEALDLVGEKRTIPIVYNCGGYEKKETIEALKGYVDLYLPDFKYMDDTLALSYSEAPNYFQNAAAAITEMIAQTGSPVFDREGIMKKGVLLRHLVLPGHKDDSIRLLHWISQNLPKDGFYISLLSQYTPLYQSSQFPKINRRLTTYEYDKVVETALSLGLNQGFIQEKTSAGETYIPPFSQSCSIETIFT